MYISLHCHLHFPRSSGSRLQKATANHNTQLTAGFCWWLQLALGSSIGSAMLSHFAVHPRKMSKWKDLERLSTPVEFSSVPHDPIRTCIKSNRSWPTQTTPPRHICFHANLKKKHTQNNRVRLVTVKQSIKKFMSCYLIVKFCVNHVGA
jgi:hypothetical protein